jgi:hypothetical protein
VLGEPADRRATVHFSLTGAAWIRALLSPDVEVALEAGQGDEEVDAAVWGDERHLRGIRTISVGIIEIRRIGSRREPWEVSGRTDT